MVSLITGVAAISLQSIVLQIIPIRRMLNIPVVPANMQGRLPTFRESIQFVVERFADQHRAANNQKPRKK
jgi:hypothetical protein